MRIIRKLLIIRVLIFNGNLEHIFSGMMQTADAKGTGSVEELQKLAKENGMELDAAQAEEMYARLHPVTQELSDDELDNVTGGDSCDVGYSCPKCGSTEASSREPLYGCTYVTCACCGATYWDPTSTKTQN